MSEFDYTPEIDFDRKLSSRPGVPVEPRRLLHVLIRGWRPIAIASAAGLFLGLVIFSLWPKDYVSQARLLYEGVPALSRKNVNDKPYALIESAAVPENLKEVRIRAGVHEAPEKFEKRITVQIDGAGMYDTNAMVVQGQGDTPEQAHGLVAALVEVFLEKQVELNKRRLKVGVEDVQSSLEGATSRRKNAQIRYQTFIKDIGRGDVVAIHKQAASDAIKLKVMADEHQVEATVQAARVQELRRSLKTMPKQVLASATQGSPIDAPLAKARADLASAIATKSEEHPRVIALRQRVANLEAQKQETGTEIGAKTLTANPARDLIQQSLVTAKAERAAALQREKSHRRLVERAYKKANELGPAAAEGQQLQAELTAADTHAKKLDERLTALKDALRSSPSGFRTVTQASMPQAAKPSTARWSSLWLPSLLCALLVALAIAFIELRGLRVQTASEVAWWGHGPVLGTSMWPRDPEALEPFIDELEDQGARGIGQTLVVPATAAEREMALAFAMKLAEAPWLAAAILDVEIGRRRPMSGYPPHANPILTPSPNTALPPGAITPPSASPQTTPPPNPAAPDAAPLSMRPVRASRNTLDGIVVPKRNTPVIYAHPPVPNPPAESQPSQRKVSARPPARTVIMGSVKPSPPSSEVPEAIPLTRRSPPPPKMPSSVANRQRNTPSIEGVAHASVRMVVHPEDLRLPTASGGDEAEAVLLTRPTLVAGHKPHAANTGGPILVGRALRVDGSGHQGVDLPVSNTVLRAAIRILTDDRSAFDSYTPEGQAGSSTSEQGAVALAWNGPLVGPVLRRAARLAHRVIVVVPAGSSATELNKVRTRLGRSEGVGYVLVNLADSYAELHDRIGPVDAFWQSTSKQAHTMRP